jgi:hypothetical protein
MSDIDCFEALERGLQESGLTEEADSLRQTRTSVYTTSSELYGELGETVGRIYRVVPTDAAQSLRKLFKACERSVRNAWSEFRLRRDA